MGLTHPVSPGSDFKLLSQPHQYVYNVPYVFNSSNLFAVYRKPGSQLNKGNTWNHKRGHKTKLVFFLIIIKKEELARHWLRITDRIATEDLVICMFNITLHHPFLYFLATYRYHFRHQFAIVCMYTRVQYFGIAFISSYNNSLLGWGHTTQV